MRTSDRDDWETPPDVFAALNGEFQFTLDPCCTVQTAKCARFFTSDDDGLSQDWGTESVFVNPPYGRELAKWVAKSLQASLNGATVVLLIPARTDTAYFHEHIYGVAEIRFLRGRIYFHRDGVAVDRAPFPSMVVVFRPMGFVDSEERA
jgi:site-specific DNA-methyltransferase (adenine-specific)